MATPRTQPPCLERVQECPNQNQYCSGGLSRSPTSARLKNIALATGGNYYEAVNAAALPRIFIREAMRVSRPLVFEPEGGVQPQITYPHEIVQGLSRDLPPLRGFVLTTPRPVRSSKFRSKPTSHRNPRTNRSGDVAIWGRQDSGLYQRCRQALGQFVGPVGRL